MLTKSCEGYPLTEVELNILGLVMAANNEPSKRDYVEQHSNTIPKLAYMIVDDLTKYDFLSLDDHSRLMITPRGEKALEGIAHRIYSRKFSADMLAVSRDKSSNLTIERAPKKEDEQTDLF
jgi:hypothetical protein